MPVLKEGLKRRLPLIIAIACGILAVMMLNAYLQQKEQEMVIRARKQAEKALEAQKKTQEAAAANIASLGQTKEVVVAKNRIAKRSAITPNDITLRKIPLSFIEPGAFISPTDVIGKIAAIPMAQGEQILNTKVASPQKIGTSLSQITPRGKRAMTVSVTPISSVGGLVEPGDYVDIFALLAMPSSNQWSGTRSGEGSTLVPLFQGVLILAVGKQIADPLSFGEQQGGKKVAQSANNVTVALTPQEAALLSFVQDHGTIKLMLRSQEDDDLQVVKSADWDMLFRHLYPGSSIDDRQPQEDTGGAVEIYRGLSREVISVPR